MNRQGPNGIEYCSHTWNITSGCLYDCQWEMPDGSTAQCYAKTTAEGLAFKAYPDGFRHHYWHPERLQEPNKLRDPARIFINSMGDVMGWWVPVEHLAKIFYTVKTNKQHTFLLLTKNAPRLLEFIDYFTPNLWVGVSMPPTIMNNTRLSSEQQSRYLHRTLEVLQEVHSRGIITWMSFEPLSFDVGALLNEWYWGFGEKADIPLDWAVIGAASNGKTYYQPEKEHVNRLMNTLRRGNEWIPVFMKGNLKWDPRREEFPETVFEPVQLELF